VKGYKSPLHPFPYLSLAHFDLQNSELIHSPSLVPLALVWQELGES
jgi:hypothetical protein